MFQFALPPDLSLTACCQQMLSFQFIIKFFNHFRLSMSVRLGHLVRRSFFFSSSRFQNFKFIALINDLNNQAVTPKSSGTSLSTFH